MNHVSNPYIIRIQFDRVYIKDVNLIMSRLQSLKRRVELISRELNTIENDIKNRYTYSMSVPGMELSVDRFEYNPKYKPSANFYNQLIEHRRRYLGTNDLFHPKLIRLPMKQFIQAWKDGRERELVKVRGSKELYNKLYNNK